jgi:hypothetical protein
METPDRLADDDFALLRHLTEDYQREAQLAAVAQRDAERALTALRLFRAQIVDRYVMAEGDSITETGRIQRA